MTVTNESTPLDLSVHNLPSPSSGAAGGAIGGQVQPICAWPDCGCSDTVNCFTEVGGNAHVVHPVAVGISPAEPLGRRRTPLTAHAELLLAPSKQFPRRLMLTLRDITGRHPYLCVSLSARGVYLGGCTSDLSECYLDITTDCPFVCVASATYRVSAAEVARIRAAFAQLRVRDLEETA